MGAQVPPERPGPPWEYLIAHHFPPRYARTIGVRVRGRPYHLCARCSGQVLGALAYIAVFFATPLSRALLFDPRVEWVFAFFPLLAAWDWFTQAVGRRESTNLLRLASGALLGFAVLDVLALLLRGQWFLLAGAILIVAIYVGGIGLALRASGAWRKVLEEHFPGIPSQGFP